MKTRAEIAHTVQTRIDEPVLHVLGLAAMTKELAAPAILRRLQAGQDVPDAVLDVLAGGPPNANEPSPVECAFEVLSPCFRAVLKCRQAGPHPREIAEHVPGRHTALKLQLLRFHMVDVVADAQKDDAVPVLGNAVFLGADHVVTPFRVTEQIPMNQGEHPVPVLLTPPPDAAALPTAGQVRVTPLAVVDQVIWSRH